jgi:hypothetical protein
MSLGPTSEKKIIKEEGKKDYIIKKIRYSELFNDRNISRRLEGGRSKDGLLGNLYQQIFKNNAIRGDGEHSQFLLFDNLITRLKISNLDMFSYPKRVKMLSALSILMKTLYSEWSNISSSLIATNIWKLQNCSEWIESVIESIILPEIHFLEDYFFMKQFIVSDSFVFSRFIFFHLEYIFIYSCPGTPRTRPYC